MSLKPNFSIQKIWDNGISAVDSGLAWIGDGEAANFVAKNFEGGSIYEFQKVFNRTIKNPKFTTVGGYSILAQGKEDGFKFLPYMKLVSPRYKPIKSWKTVDFGTAQTGGFGFTTITPKQPGNNGYGIYFFQGRFGYFFHVDLQNNIAERLKARAKSINEFIKIIEREIHIPLDYCGSLG